MEKSARNFIYWVLLIHALLLLLALGIVSVAARTVYVGARRQAIASAQQTQELLARETTAGIENYYKAVSAGLELLKPFQEEGGAASAGQSSAAGAASPAEPALASARAGGNTAPLPGAVGTRELNTWYSRSSATMPASPVIDALWAEIRQRAAILLLVDFGPAGRPLIMRHYSALPDLDPRKVVDDAMPWLRHITGPTLGPFIQTDGIGYTLMASPMRGRAIRILVALVPIAQVNSELMQWAGEHSGVMMIEDDGTVMTSPDGSLVGQNLLTGLPGGRSEPLAAFAAKYVHGGMGGSEVVPITPPAAPAGGGAASGASNGVSGGASSGGGAVPTLLTIQPIEFSQFGDRRWWLIISSGLEGVDAVVNSAFRDAALWAGCLVVSVAAILASTAVWLIRGRMRLERLRTEMLHRELEQARRIQLSWLPAKPLESTRIEVAAINRPASHVSGDFYDWFELPDGRVTVTVGDVTGHGLTAAFLMATTQLLVRATMQRVGDPGHCIQEVNRQLCTQVFNGQFVTLLVMTIDFEEGEMLVASAGHPAPMIGSGGAYKPLKLDPQFLLGLEPDADFASQAFPLKDGQSILLYTDGVCDAVSTDGSRFTEQGLADVLDHQYETADSIINAVAAAVETFAAGAQLFDDLTLVAVRLQRGQLRKPRLAASSR